MNKEDLFMNLYVSFMAMIAITLLITISFFLVYKKGWIALLIYTITIPTSIFIFLAIKYMWSLSHD